MTPREAILIEALMKIAPAYDERGGTSQSYRGGFTQGVNWAAAIARRAISEFESLDQGEDLGVEPSRASCRIEPAQPLTAEGED